MMGCWFSIPGLLLGGVQVIEVFGGKEGRMNKERQRQLETILTTGMAFGLKSLVIDRFIEDLVPEQRGFKDDVARAVTTAVTTAVSMVLASAIVRQLARSRWGS